MGTPSVTGVSSTSHTRFRMAALPFRFYVPVLLINDVNGCNSTHNQDAVWIVPVPVPVSSLPVLIPAALPPLLPTIHFHEYHQLVGFR